jgi:hypothetical protein
MYFFVMAKNRLRAIARKGAIEVTDEIVFDYRIVKWNKPACFDVCEAGRTGDVVTIEARLFDQAAFNAWMHGARFVSLSMAPPS